MGSTRTIPGEPLPSLGLSKSACPSPDESVLKPAEVFGHSTDRQGRPSFESPSIHDTVASPSPSGNGQQTRKAVPTKLPPRPQDQADGVRRAEASRGRPQAGGQPQRAAPHRPDPANRPEVRKPDDQSTVRKSRSPARPAATSCAAGGGALRWPTYCSAW